MSHPFDACVFIIYASVTHWGHACGLPEQANSLFQNSRYKKGTYTKQSTKLSNFKIFILNPDYYYLVYKSRTGLVPPISAYIYRR